MQLRCYADDPREPDLIGEAIVDLSEVLTKGETDGENKYENACVLCIDGLSQIGLH